MWEGHSCLTSPRRHWSHRWVLFKSFYVMRGKESQLFTPQKGIRTMSDELGNRVPLGNPSSRSLSVFVYKDPMGFTSSDYKSLFASSSFCPPFIYTFTYCMCHGISDVSYSFQNLCFGAASSAVQAQKIPSSAFRSPNRDSHCYRNVIFQTGTILGC